MREPSNNMDSLWYKGALGMWVLAGFNAVLLVSAWIQFALQQPEYFQEAWPTFSRALADGPSWTHGWLAGIAGAGLFIGSLALAVMRWRQAAAMQQRAGWMRALALVALFSAGLGIVHYFHVVFTLAVDNDMHMAMSYLFFFGMTFVILFDMAIRPRLDIGQPIELVQTRGHRATGLALMAAAILFLVTYVLKDMASNPLAGPTQKLFVVMELSWIVLAHAYGVFYVAPLRVFFRPAGSGAGAALPAWFALTVLGLALAFPAASALAEPARAATANIGGTGRIQPVGGVITLSGPHGHLVERVEVKEGQRVRKGAVMLVLADRANRSLERDLALERLRGLEQQSAARRKVAELDVEAARMAVADAREDQASLAKLDERTIALREKRQRERAVGSAETTLRQALARLDEVKQSLESERRSLRMNLQLAEAQLATTQIKAPMDANVLEVNARPGMTLGGPAIVLADTSSMYVVADFFEGDLPRLAPGQRVKVSNNALGTPLLGSLERIGRVVDPVNRLAKAWIKLDQAAPADRYIGMQVDVSVTPGAPAR